MIFRRRFGDLVSRQLDLFASEHADLLEDVEVFLRAYNEAPRDEAEERYGDYVDRVDLAAEALAEIRNTYARTLDEAAADEYEQHLREGGCEALPAARLGARRDLRRYLRPKLCGCGIVAATSGSSATRRASGPSDSSPSTITLRFRSTRSKRPCASTSGSPRTIARKRS